MLHVLGSLAADARHRLVFDRAPLREVGQRRRSNQSGRSRARFHVTPARMRLHVVHGDAAVVATSVNLGDVDADFARETAN